MTEVWEKSSNCFLKIIKYLINLWISPAQGAMLTLQDRSHDSIRAAKTKHYPFYHQNLILEHR